MRPTVHRGVPDTVADTVLRWLPDSEFAASLLDDATGCAEAVDPDGGTAAVIVVAQDRPTLSGAPVVVACAGSLDGDWARVQGLATTVAPFAVAAGVCEVSGPADVARDVAAAAAAAVGGTVSTVMEQRLMVTTAPRVPAGVLGRARRAEGADRMLVASWFDAFAVEALGAEPRGADHWMAVLEQPQWRIWLWEVAGRPVSLVNTRRTTPVSGRVGPVYTPVEERGHGYAGALLATVASARLTAGDTRVTLFTDADNPASNAAYAKVGFVDVGAHGSWLVTAP